MAHFLLQLAKAAALVFQATAQSAAADIQLTGDHFHIGQPARGTQQTIANLSGQAATHLTFGQQGLALQLAELGAVRIGARQGQVEQVAGETDAILRAGKFR